MKHREFSLIGGALLGMAAMYFFDPETGERRRRVVRAKAEDAFRGAGGALGDAWEHAQKLGSDVVSHARDIGGDVSDRARDAADSASASLSDFHDQAGQARDHAARHLHGLRNRIGGFAHNLADRASQATHPWRHKLAHSIDPDHDEGMHAAGIAGISVGTLAIGAGAMYLFDPAQGRQRREYVGNQLSKCVQETGQICRLAGDYVARLWHRGVGGGDSSREPSNPLTGEQLVQRARGRIAHILSNPAHVQLMADADGVLTIFGRVSTREADVLLDTLGKVEGVRRVENRLETEDPIEASPATQPAGQF